MGFLRARAHRLRSRVHPHARARKALLQERRDDAERDRVTVRLAALPRASRSSHVLPDDHRRGRLDRRRTRFSGARVRKGLPSLVALLLVPVATPPAAAAETAGTAWFALPVVFYMPETRLGFGALGGVHFRVEPQLETSDVQIIASGTARRQALFNLTSQLFPSEELALGGVVKLSRYPDFFYGVGNDTPARAKEAFTSRSVEVQLSPEWYLVPHRLRTGPRAWFRQESFRDLAPGGQLASGTLPGVEDYAALGFGWSASWDTRDSRFFPRRGNAVEAWYLLSRRPAGDAPRFGRGALDARQFFPLGGQVVLGLGGHFELAHGDVPVTLLPRLGGDQNLRGYYQGRWRDHFMYSGQAELRLPVAGRLSATVFAGASDVAAQLSAFDSRTVRPAAGAGARFRLTDDGLNVRLDVAVGAEGANVYFSLGEAF
jgi:surface antigen Omp85-like protein